MVKRGPLTCRIRPALHGGAVPIPQRSRRGLERHRCFVEFLSCSSNGSTDMQALSTFVFGEEDEADSTKNEGATSAFVTAAATAAALGGGSECAHLLGQVPPELGLACMPMVGLGFSSEAGAAEADGLSTRARYLQRTLTGFCFAQASIATLEFALSDAVSGLIGCGIATLGLQASTPAGYRFLPSYIVLAFCNGTMQVLLGTELAAANGWMLSQATVPFSLKLATATAIASPMMMFAGLAVAWHLHCELRTLALQALPRGLVPGQPTSDGLPQSPAPGQASGLPIPPGSLPSGNFQPFSGQPHRLEHQQAK